MKAIYASALAGLALVATATAQTQITVTGATAFREAAVEAIKAAYLSTGNSNFAYAYTGSSFGAASQHYFTGEFPGIAGVTIVRTSWSGSVEGVEAVFEENAVNVMENPTTSPTGTANQTASTGTRVANLTFSDVIPDQTPYGGSSFHTEDVGVITFVMTASQSAPAQFTNVTQQQFKALSSEGFLPLSAFTGLDSDDATFVFNTGRNDGSGTRTVYLAESGYGYSRLVQQYKETANDGVDAITAIRQWPTGETAIGNASTIWNADTAGNGGYSSGGTLRAVLGRTSSSVDIYAADNSLLVEDFPILMISSIGLSDGLAAKNLGAKPLAYNGVSITPVAIGTVDDTALPGDPANTTGNLKAGDKRKIANGQYSLWSFEQFMYDNDGVNAATTDEITFFGQVIDFIQLQPSIGTSGLTMTEMGSTTRSAAGGVIFP